MKHKILILIALLALTLSACGGTSTKSSGPLDGTWKSTAPDMTAKVINNTIEIDFTRQGETALYWKGTLPPTSADGAEITSSGDTDAMNESMFGSEDSSKKFVYTNGKITFPFGILGTTQTVELEK